ncbi:MAG: hypothetical protein MJ130_10415 [Lachnospiraceae bacterium]|nr:hypothetical protein [Lachnospiraceae bacterium]
MLELKANVDSINKRLSKYPKGMLKVRKTNMRFSYCIKDIDTKKIAYVRKENIKQAQTITQRDYEQSYLKIAEREISDIERILAKNYSDRAKNCYSGIIEGRKRLVQPFEMSDEDFVNQWSAVPYKSKDFMENDATEYYTDNGERVRSKSELIIANMLKTLNIPYKYECPLKLGNIIVYPDFTILDVKGRTEKYLEHFGMMGDIDYVNNMVLKISSYEQNNIFLGDRLICTFESAKRPLNISILKNKLNSLLYNNI